MLYPELRRIPQDEQAAALQRARAQQLDSTERIGTIAAVVVASWLTNKLGVSAAFGGGSVGFVGVFLVALPMIGLLAGPFLVRRTRRGFRDEMGQRGE
jgi:hypothetical protein